jgi:hypothetical protein
MLTTLSIAAVWLATGLGFDVPPCGADIDQDSLELCLISVDADDSSSEDEDDHSLPFRPIRGWIYNGF